MTLSGPNYLTRSLSPDRINPDSLLASRDYFLNTASTDNTAEPSGTGLLRSTTYDSLEGDVEDLVPSRGGRNQLTITMPTASDFVESATDDEQTDQ